MTDDAETRFAVESELSDSVVIGEWIGVSLAMLS
jgi:hypothetical protein